MTRHPFDEYYQKHGHYPKATLKLTRRFRIEVQVTRGYAIVSTYPYGRTTYIPRNQLVRLLKWLTPLVRQMDSNWNVEERFEQYLRDEDLLAKDLKRQKREARQSRTLATQEKADRQRRRFLAAKRRGAARRRRSE